jgi:hypothetical protein
MQRVYLYQLATEKVVKIERAKTDGQDLAHASCLDISSNLLQNGDGDFNVQYNKVQALSILATFSVANWYSVNCFAYQKYHSYHNYCFCKHRCFLVYFYLDTSNMN